MPQPVGDLKVMSFGEHLEELRHRLARSIAVTLLFALIALIFQSTLMQAISGPHRRAMQQVQGRRLAEDLEERLAELRRAMVSVPLREGGAAIAIEEENAADIEALESLARERLESEPLAVALHRVLREQGRKSITGSGIAARITSIRTDLLQSTKDHAWGAGDPIEASDRHLDSIEEVVALWRAEARDPGDGKRPSAAEALLVLRSVDSELESLEVFSDRLSHWRQEKVPLKLLSYVEAFFSHLKLAFLVGLLCGLPWITYEIWLFIGAGLYSHERSAVGPFLPFSLIGLVLGGLFAYYVLIPVGLSYLGGYGDPDLFDPSFTLTNYLSLVFTLLIGMGLVFQLPLLMIFLSRSGMVSPEQFRKVRKYSILGALVTGAFLTPPDVVTQMLMAIPLVILYETGILASVWFRRRAANREKLARESVTSDDAAGEDR